MHDAPRAPRRIALVSGEARGDVEASAALLADFADALLAYERQSARELGLVSNPPELRGYVLRPEGEMVAARDVEGPAEEMPPPVDALVLGFPLDTDSPAPVRPDRLEPLSEKGLLTPGVLVYAVCTAEAGQAGEVSQRLLPLAQWCESRAARWCGALVVERGSETAGMVGLPRMGLVRRNVSEATDRLVAAARAGLTVRQAARIFGATRRQAELAERGVIKGRYPLPAAMLAAGYFRSRKRTS